MENYAYANYYSDASAQDAVRGMNLTSLDDSGAVITVKVQGERRHSGTTNTVKISNISKKVSEDLLEEYFNFKGSVEVQSVKVNNLEGPFNYGYVNYTSLEDAQRAEKELNGIQIDGCTIAVMHKIHGKGAIGDSRMPLVPLPMSACSVSSTATPLSESCTVKASFSGALSADDLERFFSKYGKLKDKPVILGARPKYAYINYEEQPPALRARSLEGHKIKRCKVTVRLVASKFRSSKPTSPSVPFDRCKQIPCNSLVVRMLLTSEKYSGKLKEVTLAHQVTVNEMKRGNGATMWGSEENIEAALPLIESLMQVIRSELQTKAFTLPCLYVPLFQNPNTVSMAAQIERKHCVEILVMDTGGLVQDVGAFSQVVTREFACQIGMPQVACLAKYLKPDVPDLNEYRWLWENDTGGYTPYSSMLCTTFSKEFATSPKGTLQCRISAPKGKASYTINFAAMTQTNMKTKYVRQIKIESNSALTHGNSVHSRCHQVTLQFRGPLGNLQQAKTELESELKQSTVSKQHPLPAESDESFRTSLLETTSRYFVSAKVVGASAIELRGIQGHIEQVSLRVKEDILSHEKAIFDQRAFASSQCHLPNEWEPQKEKMALKRLKQTTPEWNKVCAHLMETLTSVKILSIQRIQNKWLWQRYCFAKQRMSDKNKGVVNEKALFHGTRSTPPEKIYKSEQGFDFRYSYKGMWGTGTYFAVNASYSSAYAFQSGEIKQMILAKVLTGETVRCPPDNALKKPPIKKPSSLGAIAKLLPSGSEFEDELYDSVSGHTNGSDIFVVYDHEKAYPAYLIDYN